MELAITEFLRRFVEGNNHASEYPVDVLQNFICSLILSKDFDDKRSPKCICEELLDKHSDIWYYGIGLLNNLVAVSATNVSEIPARDSHLLRIARMLSDNAVKPETVVKRVYLILEKVKRPTPQLQELSPSLAISSEKKLSAYRIQFKKCWAEFLRCCGSALTKDLLVKLLRIIPDSVMPHIQNPEIFASFFTDCFNMGSDLQIALLSLAGLFHLISKHNLGEPTDLYSRLFTLVSPATMKKSAQSNRVFQLLVKALRSPLMPTQLVPVFAKRLLRVAVLVESPSMTLWLVVAAFNLMQSHPIVSIPLIHREVSDQQSLMDHDPFDLACEDIHEMVKALSSSSLWELELLTQHADPSVVRMACLFKTNFFSRKAKRISSDDYLLISDEQLMGRERKYGTHSKAKKTKGDIELEKIAGEDKGSDLEIPIAVLTPLSEQSRILNTMFLENLA